MSTPQGSMRAAVYTTYGPPDVVTVRDVPRPAIKPNQALVRIHAAPVTTGDARIRAWDIPSLPISILARLMFGVFKPRKPILGTAFAGTIETVGDEVSGFEVGDRVFGASDNPMGAHAEFIATDTAKHLCKIPNGLSFEQAAALPFAGSATLYFLRDLAKVQSDQRVLIVGASGALGISGVQYAKHIGAHVTGVCSGGNEAFVRGLGADEVIDYTRGDWTKHEAEHGRCFDVVYDTAGKTSYTRCKHLLKERGVYIPAVMRIPELLQLVWTPLLSKRAVKSGVAFSNAEFLKTLAELADSGATVPQIERTYPLNQIAQAHRDVDTGHRSGIIVVRMVD
ncbi:MAG: NAD(P)-dependent alcohol dehydrogenase [Phycisphaerales bacterium JB047]